MNLAEAAMLAGLFKAPTRFAPHVNLPAARARANMVLDNLVEAGMMTEGQVFGARRNPATALDRRDERVANYYLDYAFDEMKKLVATFPKSLHERVFVVRTGLDVNLQREAENAVESMLRQYGDDYKARQAAAVVLDLDGAVRAMVGGRDYGQSQFNRATDALRQPGSSFKPYVYAAALTNGYKPTSIVVDAPICLGNWCPQNYSHSFSGSMTLTQALARSINVIPVRLSVSLGDGNPKIGRAKIIQIGAAHGHPHAAARLLLAADRRRGSDRARPYRRLRDLPQSRQGGDAACDARSAQRQRRSRLALRPRRQEAGAGAAPAGRDGHELDDEQGGRGRHRPARASSRASRRRARPAPPTPIATPGSSATPATMSAACGSATTITRRPTA